MLGGRHAASPISRPAPGRCSRIPARRFIGLNVQPFDAGQASRAAARRRRARRPRRARRRARRLAAPDVWREAATRGKEEWLKRRRALSRRDQRAELPSDAQVLGALQRAGRAERHRRLRRRRPARRIAQAVAGGRAARLSRRIWLFLHGLRDRRRLGVKLAQPEREVDRRRRRRLLSDDEFGDRDLGDARRQADHRRQRQPRLRLHQSPAACDRRRVLQQPAARRAPRDAAGRSISSPMRAASAPRRSRSNSIAELESAFAASAQGARRRR